MQRAAAHGAHPVTRAITDAQGDSEGIQVGGHGWTVRLVGQAHLPVSVSHRCKAIGLIFFVATITPTGVACASGKARRRVARDD